jgi:hypothetical protein
MNSKSAIPKQDFNFEPSITLIPQPTLEISTMRTKELQECEIKDTYIFTYINNYFLLKRIIRAKRKAFYELCALPILFVRLPGIPT